MPASAQVRVRTVRRRARLLYLPAYVADYKFGEAFNAHGERRPQRFKAIVSGMDANSIAAERHFSPHKVTSAFRLACAASHIAAHPAVSVKEAGVTWWCSHVCNKMYFGTQYSDMADVGSVRW